MNTTNPIVELKTFTTEVLQEIPKWKTVCETAAISKTTPSYKHFVVEFEEKGLEELATPTSEAARLFLERMKVVATAANVNLFVFIGHSDICLNYIDEINNRLREGTLTVPNSLPSVILIIGCLGEGYLAKYLREAKYKPLRDKNFHFFGFQNLVHVYQGQIYNCEKPHLKLPKQDCKHINTTNGQKACCNAKFGSFEKIFLESLNERNCTQISNEKLIEKFRQLHGTTSFSAQFFLLGKDDGKACTKTEICTTPSSEMMNANMKSKAFNQMAEGMDDLWLELIEQFYIITYEYGSSSKYIDILRKLKKTDLPVFTHIYTKPNISIVFDYLGRQAQKQIQINSNNNMFLLFFISIHQYEIVMYLLTQKTFPIPFSGEAIRVMIRNFSHERDNQYNSSENWRNMRNGLGKHYNSFDDWQIYNLLEIAYEKDPAVFTTPVKFSYEDGGISPFLDSLHAQDHPTIWDFFYRHFRGKINWESLSTYTDPINRNLEIQRITQFSFDPRYTKYVLYLGIMGADLNVNSFYIKSEIGDYLEEQGIYAYLNDNDRKNYKEYLDLLKYLIAFGFRNCCRKFTSLKQAILDSPLLYFFQTGDSGNAKNENEHENENEEFELEPNLMNNLAMMIQTPEDQLPYHINNKGSKVYRKETYTNEFDGLYKEAPTYNAEFTEAFKEQARLKFEAYLDNHNRKRHLSENLEARKQFPILQGTISKLLKKIPEGEREDKYKIIDAILTTETIPEWRRLRELQTVVLQPLQAELSTQPRQNTTARNPQGGRRKRRKTRRRK